MKGVLSSMPNVNVIDDLMASIQDSLDEGQQIQASLDQSLRYEEVDDDELLAELQQLTAEEARPPPIAVPKESISMENLLQEMGHLEIRSPKDEQNSELNSKKKSLILE